MGLFDSLKKMRPNKVAEDVNDAKNESTKNKNPYLEARSQYEDRYGSEVKNSARLRRVCMALIFLCVMLGSSMAWLAAQNKVVPYIVQVDQHGYAIAIKSAEEGSLTSTRVAIATLGRIIMDFRSVVADPRAQERLIANVYACVAKDSAAEQTVHAYYKDNNPYSMAKDKNMGKIININSISPFSDKKGAGSWQVLWTEQTTQLGRVINVATYRAIITIAISPAGELDQVIANPLGIYLTEMHITKDML